MAERKIAACNPSRSNRRVAIPHAAVLYKQRHKIEKMFGRLKDWRRVHASYDRCAHTYFSAICIAAAAIFWLKKGVPESSPRSGASDRGIGGSGRSMEFFDGAAGGRSRFADYE